MSVRQLWLWLLCLSASIARAQADSGFTLQLQAPNNEHCIDAASLTRAIEARTGRSARAPQTAAAVRVNVQIDRTAQGYRANLSIQNAQRELQVEGSCSELDEMLVVVIASSLGITPDSERKARAGTRTSPAAPVVAWKLDSPLTAAEPIQPREPVATPEAGTSQPWQLEVSASARMLTAIMPRATFGPALSLFARWGALGLHASGTWLPSTAYTLPSTLTLRATGGLGELGVCGLAAGETRLLALFCADLSAGAIEARLDPLPRSAARWDGLVMLVPHAQARLQLSATFGVALALGAAIPVIFPRYLYGSTAGEQRAAHTPELGLFAELGLWLKILP